MQISDEQYEEMQGRVAMMTNILAFLLSSGVTISILKEELTKFVDENPSLSVVTLPDEKFWHVWLGKAP